MNDGVDLSGRVAVVTGGARGIGLGIAKTLALHHARVLIADIDDASAAAAVEDIVGDGGEAASYVVDVTRGDDVRAMVDYCTSKWGTLDILINNAGDVTREVVEDTSDADWRRVLDVNLTGPFLCSKAALPVMRRNGFGKIVNVSSTGGRRISYNGGASYTASKEGLLGLTRHLAFEVAHLGINVNAICPGTTITRTETRVAPPGYADERAKLIPRGRLATVEDSAHAVLFLVSDLADYICGAVLDVDGGSLLGWQDVDTYWERRRSNL